jgi:glycosyl transferase family 2
MAGPVVSVIVPGYNAASTVQETLRPVLAQTVAQIEVIVVELTRELSRFLDPRLKMANDNDLVCSPPIPA